MTWNSVRARDPSSQIACFNQIADGPMIALPLERGIDHVPFPLRPAPHDREIFFQESLSLHEQTETARGHLCLGHQNEAAGFAIEPVNDRNLSAIGNFKCEHFAQSLPKCRGSIRLLRVCQQQRRLIDHNVIGRLIDNPKARGWQL